MKKLILLILSSFFVILLHGQKEYLFTYHPVPEIDDDYCGPSLKCKNGDQLITYALEENKTPNYPKLLYFLRLDSLGNIIWSKVIQNQIHVGFKIIEDDEGNFYHFSGHAATVNATIIKFSKNGEVLWIKSYGNNNSTFIDATILSTGEMIAVGATTKKDGIEVTYIVKLNKDGGVIWVKATNFAQRNYGELIIVTDDGGCIIAGVRDEDSKPGRYIAKIDTNAKLLWLKSFDFNGANNIKILKTGTNNYTIVGQRSQIVLTNIDETGKINWSKRLLHKNGDLYAIGYNDIIMKGNNIIMGGWIANKPYKMFLLNFSEEGKINWQSIFSTNYKSGIIGIQQNSNQGFDLYGYFEEVTGASDAYPFLMKTDSLGQIPCLSEIDYNPPLQVVDYPVKVDSGGTLITLNNVAVLDTPIIRTDITFTKKVICESNATQNIHNNASQLFTLYPNPASSEVSIDLTPEYQVYGSKLQIEISDALGRRVYGLRPSRYENVVVPKGILSAGYYFVSVVSQGKVLQSQKLVVVE